MPTITAPGLDEHEVQELREYVEGRLRDAFGPRVYLVSMSVHVTEFERREFQASDIRFAFVKMRPTLKVVRP
jgi:hypothetical protein